jgi:two-component system chemotaxis sensor kinase CheA
MIDKFKQAFQEEAREILLELESSLLALNERQGDAELVGRAFRALHTIKGSGSMFGFDEIATFTHHIENAFDQVRDGRLAATTELVGLSLAAVDQIKSMLDEAAGQGNSDRKAAARILEKLGALTGVAEKNAPAKSAAAASSAAAEIPAGAVNDWHLRLSPKPDMLRNGANPQILFRELRQMGNLRITAELSAVPALGEIDPQRCYIVWDMILSTAVTPESIRDVFIFVEDGCELAIDAVARRTTQPSARETSAPAERVERNPSGGRRASDKEIQGPTIRVAAAKLEQLIDLMGQLVTVQVRLGEIAARSEDRDIQSVAEEIGDLTAELRENSMSLRTQPLRSTFERFKRLVFDLRRSLHKEVELTYEGGDTELDKTVIDQLNDPLMHLIRNSMDHGVEMPDVRRAVGKNPTANIHFTARHEGAQVLIRVADDGKGIDRDAVRARAIERGLVTADARLSQAEIFSLILAPGFSTASEVTDVSGRGVGMDVVKRNVEALRGTIEIDSQTGVGSSVTLRLPLTLAIIDGLLVRVGQTRFVMPLSDTVECVELTRQDIENAGGKHVAYIRGEVVPYIRLSEHLQIHSERPEREQVMVAKTEHGRFGFAVDQVLGDHQTAIKNLGRLYRNVQVVSGATILGDGTVALILDLHRIVQAAIRTTDVDARTHLHAPCKQLVA